MRKINILYVITKLELGGAQKQLLSLILHLDKKRFEPFLFTAREGLLVSEASSISGLTLKRSRCLERAINPFKDLLALIQIYWFIKKNDIQILHTHSSKAGVLARCAARLAKVRVIIHTVHGWSFNDYQPVLCQKLFIWLERFIGRFTDKFVVVSLHDKQKGLKNCIGNEEKYALIRYGIDYAEFGRREKNIREELGINATDLVVGMISSFKAQKSPQDFIKLALGVNQILPNVRFILVGDGVLRKSIERLIRKFTLQQHIILTGWRRDIPDILSAADVFVLTSLWEGLPVAALEALASAKPVVATYTGGISEVIVEGENGFLVSPTDMQGMCKKLTILLRNSGLRKAMSENAKEALTSDFLADTMVEKTQDLYKDLICKKEASRAS